MALGIGWVNSSCENISGCDWIVDSVDYAGAFFTSMDSCQQICMALYNNEDPLFPSSYNLYKNYPNPFRGAPVGSDANCSIYVAVMTKHKELLCHRFIRTVTTTTYP